MTYVILEEVGTALALSRTQAILPFFEKYSQFMETKR